MLERMIYLRPALERLIRLEYKLGPSGFVLSSTDWDLLDRLKEVLSIFVVATTHISATQYPTRQFQLPYYTILLRDLYIFKDEEKEYGILALAKACEDSYNLLNRYWKKNDEHSSQVIAMILDPRIKLATFTHIGWEDEWVQKAQRKLERIDLCHYAPTTPTCTTVSTDFGTKLGPFNEITFGGPPHSDSTTPTTPSHHKSQTENYFEESVAERTVTAIEWWKLNAYWFPDLARMARNYMSVPASSVPSEQLFSRAGDIITKKRNLLLDSSSSALLLVKSWLGCPEVEKWEIDLERKKEYEEESKHEDRDINSE